MEEISLGIPRSVLESLPDGDGDSAAADMERAVEGIESRINQAIVDAQDGAEPGHAQREAAQAVVDGMEHMEARMERYDEFVPELRAWGQSPIYAICWRNLYADLLMQLERVDWLESHIERERNYRLVEDGIRWNS